MTEVIVRMWSGWASAENAPAYLRHLRNNVVPELRQIDGYLGLELLSRADGGEVEFVVMTRWGSMAAVHAFAGGDPERAVVEPEAIAVLSSFEKTVRHFKLALGDQV